MAYKHILFDVDGTLYDTYFANQDAFFAEFKQRYPERNLTTADFDAVFGLPGMESLRCLGIPENEQKAFMDGWLKGCVARGHTVKLFEGVIPLLQFLQRSGFHMAVVTSRRRHSPLNGTLGDCLPYEIFPYIKRAVCSDDVAHPKPAPDSLIHYMQLTGAKPEEILYVGDTATDLACADAAGVDFALALWGTHERALLKCAYYLQTPYDLINVLTAKPADAQWFAWARELQAIGQIGLAYCRDIYDEERFKRLREIAAQIMAVQCHEDLAKVRESIAFDKGYITPKVDTRAAIFNAQGQILLVQERSGLWNLPGGWCEENMSAAQSAIKEVREEAGLDSKVVKFIALMDRNAHNTPKLPFGALKVFVECRAALNDAPFMPNSETIARAWFSEDDLPLDKLRLDTNTHEQILMCFAAHRDPKWQTLLE